MDRIKSAQLCQGHFIGKKKGQEFLSSAGVLCHNAFRQHIFQIEMKLHDKNWGKAFVLYMLLGLLYGVQACALSRCLESWKFMESWKLMVSDLRLKST